MTFEAVHNTIRNRFNAQLVTGGSLAADDVAWDNLAFDTHNEGDSSKWVRLNVIPGESESLGLGSSLMRVEGYVQASVFLTIDKGDKLALELADEIVAAFNSVTETYSGNTVVFRTPSDQNVGREGSWWQVNVLIPFYSDNAA